MQGWLSKFKEYRKKRSNNKVLDLLPSFGLEGTEHAYPHELSGGMRQRVSFLRAVLGGHSLQLLDEPFSALDAFTRREMQVWLSKAWQQWDQSVLLITHDMEEALWLSDRIYIMSKSQVGPFLGVQIPFSRPRDKALLATKEFVELREKVTRLLYEEKVEL